MLNQLAQINNKLHDKPVAEALYSRITFLHNQIVTEKAASRGYNFTLVKDLEREKAEKTLELMGLGYKIIYSFKGLFPTIEGMRYVQ